MKIDRQSESSTLNNLENPSYKNRSLAEKNKIDLKDFEKRAYGNFKRTDFIPSSATAKSSALIQDTLDLSSISISQSLGITSQQIVDKIKEVMGKEYPGYEASYATEDNTSEKIASNIVRGATALFSIYAGQNKNLDGEELLSSFMSTIRGGVEKGYKDAEGILKALGAFDVSGVEDAIKKTMSLVEEGFKNFEATYRKEKGLPEVTKDVGAELPAKKDTDASVPDATLS